RAVESPRSTIARDRVVIHIAERRTSSGNARIPMLLVARWPRQRQPVPDRLDRSIQADCIFHQAAGLHEPAKVFEATEYMRVHLEIAEGLHRRAYSGPGTQAVSGLDV